MDFGSDNLFGASAPVLEALAAVNHGTLQGYGGDIVTKRVERQFCELFEREVRVLLVTTGTAANALSLAGCVPPWGMAICHEEAHVREDECGAPEFFMHGAKLAGLPGIAGKITAESLAGFLAALPVAIKQMPPTAVTISQVTEAGTVYSLPEIAAISKVCRDNGLALHMDGARFANALVALGCSPAEMTWKSGVDILSFGGSKNGCFAAEAIVIFKDGLAPQMDYLRKRSGHTLSKGRFLAAQFEGYLANGHWLDNARCANAMATLLRQQIGRLPGVRVPWPTQANQVFPIVSKSADQALKSSGVGYSRWHSRSFDDGEGIGDDEVMIRLVTSFATRQEDVERFAGILRSAVS